MNKTPRHFVDLVNLVNPVHSESRWGSAMAARTQSVLLQQQKREQFTLQRATSVRVRPSGAPYLDFDLLPTLPSGDHQTTAFVVWLSLVRRSASR